MRKISKLSLVAAVAVAGFTTANAQPLEEAIKNVEVSGSVVYRYDNFNDSEPTTGGNTSGKNHYKIGLNLASKVNDYVKFNSRFIIGGADSGFAGLNAKKDGGNPDQNVDVTLSNAYFALTAIPNTTVNVGKQGLATPYTKAIDINGNEQTGTGILALTTVGPVTAAAGYINQTNLDKTSDINTSGMGYTVAGAANILRNNNSATAAGTSGLNGGSDLYVAALMGDLDFVKLEAWYLGMEDTFNSYTLAAKGNIDLAEDAKIGLEARYVNLKLDNETGATGDDRKNSMFRLAADAKVSIVNARLAYTQTGKHGGLTAVDQDAENTSLGWGISSNGIANAKYIQGTIGADILDNLNFGLNGGYLKAKDNVAVVANGEYKAKEGFAQLTYKMSKNLNTYVRYGKFIQKENGDDKRNENRGRIQVAYTF